jgi:hypothetical protein
MSLINDCLLSNGLNLTGCTKQNTGGVEEIYFANFKEVIPAGAASALYTYDDATTGEITAIATGATYYRFDCVKETSVLAETVAVNVQNSTISFAPSITLVMNKMSTETRNLMYLLSLGRLIAVVKDNNGTYWMAGFKKGLDVTAVDNNTGTALGDRNGSVLTITGMEPLPMAALSSAAVADLADVASY